MDREDYELKIEGIDAEAFSNDGEEGELKKEWLLDVCKTLSPIGEVEEEGEEEEQEA